MLTCGVLAVRATRLFERQRRRAAELTLLAREAELRALRAQVRPHFLFNVLNSIYSLVGTRPAEAQEMIALLSDLLRRTLDTGDDALVPLSWELATTEAYLGIERVRLRERLQARVDLDGADPGTLVPPLLLQPLVENAVKHGVAPSVEGGRVTVEARRRQATLELTVRNDRPSAAPPATAAATHGEGRGLALTRARLEAVYGDRARMDVEPADGTFTVHLRLPVDEAR
jgi:LytS/YehU family sensor histidine kinase